MKAIRILGIVLFCLTGFSLQAQDEMQLAEQKMEYILKEVELDGEQQAKFRETFLRNAQLNMEMNRFGKEELRQIKERFTNEKNQENISVEEARAVIMRQMDSKQRKLQMESDYMRQLMENLGPVQVLQIQIAEIDFDEKMAAEKEGN